MRKYYSIGTAITIFGWFPLLFISITASFQAPWLNILLFVLGMSMCMIGSVTTLSAMLNSDFWRNLEETQKIRDEMIDAKIKYNMATKKLEKAALKITK